MAHALIFTDRAPITFNFDDLNFHQMYLAYPSGAYKLASVLRKQGLDVLVVPNCLSISFQGVRRIIEANCRDLVWVGISSTFLTVKSNTFTEYRNEWAQSNQDIIGVDKLFSTVQSWKGNTEMAWAVDELNLLSDWIKKKYDAPLLIGGSWVSTINKGNLHGLNENCYIITGYAEKYIENFTNQRLQDRDHEPPLINDNGSYNDDDFLHSTIQWEQKDFIDSGTVLPLEISRGCAFNCAYCTFDRKSKFDSYKKPDIIRDELIRNYELYGVTQYMLVDDLYNDSAKKVRVLYDKVWSKLPFSPEWSSYMRLDMLWHDKDTADIIKHSGARLGSFGIETLHDKAGRAVGKGLGRTRILETLEFLKEVWKNEVLIAGLFIAGLPYEPRESIESTMDWSVTTDLLYSVSWSPLWVTPPDHFTIVNPKAINAISDNVDKFGIEWISPNNWQNDQGLTWNEVDQMVSRVRRKLPHGLKISFSDYGDLRMGGLSHQQIANIKTLPNSKDLVQQALQTIRTKIDHRLEKIFQLSDRLGI